MRLAAPAAIVALALAACTQEAGNTAANSVAVDDPAAVGNDPATTNLTMNSSPSAVDQAINQTDEQSEFENAVGGTANSVTNSAQ